MTLLRACVLTTLVLTSLGAGVTVRAQAFQPRDPQQVLLRVARAPAGQAEPRTLVQALTSAQAWIDESRRAGEPRGFGRAEALLNRWSAQGMRSAQWHVLSADIQQYRHNFGRALDLLARALEIEPANRRALLMRAAVHQTRGELDAARADCAALLAGGEVSIGSTCLAQIFGLTGQLARARALLLRQAGDPASIDVRIWRLGALADMADRAGDPLAARAHLESAMRMQPGNQFIALAFADLLLSQGRAAEVDILLAPFSASDAVLLRRAEALHATGKSNHAVLAQLDALRLQARQRKEVVDLRSEARLLLLRGQPCEALGAAQNNWTAQREPADVRLLLLAASECYDPRTIEEIRRWQAATRYEDVRLQTLPGASRRS